MTTRRGGRIAFVLTPTPSDRNGAELAPDGGSRRSGATGFEKAQALLDVAHCRPHVIEAAAYAARAQPLWARAPGALEWLEFGLDAPDRSRPRVGRLRMLTGRRR